MIETADLFLAPLFIADKFVFFVRSLANRMIDLHFVGYFAMFDSLMMANYKQFFAIHSEQIDDGY